VGDGFDTAVRWAAGLTEPLLPTLARVAADDAMRQHAAADARWAVTLFGGALADVLTTLPPEDPWRHLSARIGDLTIGAPPRTDPGPGAWRRNRRGGRRAFGTWWDAADLAGPVPGGDVRADPGIAALADPLTPQAAAVLAFAARGRAEAHSSVAAAGPAGVTVFEAAAEALRWAVHRRRAYRGPGDLWPVEAVTVWAAHAEDPAAVVPAVPDREVIPAGAYRDLTGGDHTGR
jgi:hypothetical protein